MCVFSYLHPGFSKVYVHCSNCTILDFFIKEIKGLNKNEFATM